MVPLTSIAEEVKQECIRLGIRAVVGSQVISVKCHTAVHLHDIIIIMTSFLQFEPGEFMAELENQPQLVICSVEFLASREVHSNHS